MADLSMLSRLPRPPLVPLSSIPSMFLGFVDRGLFLQSYFLPVFAFASLKNGSIFPLTLGNGADRPIIAPSEEHRLSPFEFPGAE